ncbi:MAG: PfkB family carbohydrate kinase [Actinomycetota bacterium]
MARAAGTRIEAPPVALTPSGRRGRVAVLACAPALMVAVEPAGDATREIHLHPGGQGFWVARMAALLGADVTLVGPFGGEPGVALRALIEAEGIAVEAIATRSANEVWISADLEGEEASIARTVPPPLTRHEVDGLATGMLAAGLGADISVLTGGGDGGLDGDRFRHLAHDLHAVGGRVAADLSGPALAAALEGGLDVVKVSDEELVASGLAGPGGVADPVAALGALRARGAAVALVSRADRPLVAHDGAGVVEAATPTFQPVNDRGAGDSMTGATAAALAAGLTVRDALRLAVAAGALNVTRRGLGTGEAQAIRTLAAEVEVRPLTRDPVGDVAGAGGETDGG